MKLRPVPRPRRRRRRPRHRLQADHSPSRLSPRSVRHETHRDRPPLRGVHHELRLGGGRQSALGIPNFVAYEIKRLTKPLGKGPERPSPWITDADLAKHFIAPTDATYHHSAVFLATRPDWYVRGHLCMKEHAWRFGANADWNTHTLNAVPQRGSFNSGIWLALENRTAEWADHYGAVWIITGPIIDTAKPKAFLGEPKKKEMRIAIPDALFKIVVRETANPNEPEVLAFRFPQKHAKYAMKPYDLAYFLTTVDAIEAATGLDFFTALPKEAQAVIEPRRATKLWH